MDSGKFAYSRTLVSRHNIDWLQLSSVHKGFCVDQGFSCVNLCKKFFLLRKLLFR